MWVPGHSDIPGNFRASELGWDGALLPEYSLIQLGMPLALVKLDIARKYFRTYSGSKKTLASLQDSPGP